MREQDTISHCSKVEPILVIYADTTFKQLIAKLEIIISDYIFTIVDYYRSCILEDCILNPEKQEAAAAELVSKLV